MEVQSDFKELLELFNSHDVEYVVTGAFALAFHGAPRYTGDMDLLVNAEVNNARRIVEALDKFGFGSLGLVAEDFTKPDQVIQLGVPPTRVDILTSLSGVSWEEAEEGKAPGSCGGVTVYFLGREAFLKNKRATGRRKDLADIEALGSG